MDFRDVSVPPINPLAAKNMFFLSKKWREFRKRQVWTLLVRLIVESFWCKKLPWRELVGFSFQGMSGGCLGCGPVPVTTRIITFLVGDPYKHSFATVTGRGPHPRDATFLFQSSTTFCRGNTLWTGGPFDIFFVLPQMETSYHLPVCVPVKNECITYRIDVWYIFTYI